LSQSKFECGGSADRAESRRSADNHIRAVFPKTCDARGQDRPRSFQPLLESALLGGKDTAFHFGNLDPACELLQIATSLESPRLSAWLSSPLLIFDGMIAAWHGLPTAIPKSLKWRWTT